MAIVSDHRGKDTPPMSQTMAQEIFFEKSFYICAK
jgi:hypothetical protein